nr:hypothetical protein [Tanacetum cinerariifolium]
MYPDCDFMNPLDFIARLGYKLPSSYYEIKKTFKMIRLWYESINACANDCFLFREEGNKDLEFYPACKTSRWKDNNITRKKVPNRVLRYFFIIHRLQRFYKSNYTAKDMSWNATGKSMENGLAANGFNLFKNLSQSYSMWPVILETYNMPSWLCMKETSFILTLLIPGPKSSRKDIDVYLRPLIDDLIGLWKPKGVKTIDVVTSKEFKMRAMLLWTINDFSARSSLYGWSKKGYMACLTCNKETPSEYVLSKTAYIWDLDIGGQSTKVEAPPDIIPVDDNDDFINDEDDVAHDLADSDDKAIAKDHDEAATVMSVTLARDHDGDDGGGGDDPSRAHPRLIFLGGRGVKGQKATRRGTGGGMDGGRKGVCQETTKVVVKAAVERYDPERSCLNRKIRGRCEHMLSPRWTNIKMGIEQHFAKRYSDNKHTLKRKDPTHWLPFEINKPTRTMSTYPSYPASMKHTLMKAYGCRRMPGFNK